MSSNPTLKSHFFFKKTFTAEVLDTENRCTCCGYLLMKIFFL